MKIPFAKRGDKIVCISDIKEHERGLKCDCYCVSCEAPLIARLGEKNEHHFAHSTRLCDEEVVFLKAIYMLLQELIREEQRITLPPLIIEYSLRNIEINRNNIKTLISYVNQIPEETQHNRYIEIVKSVSLRPDQLEIRYNTAKKAEALLLEVEGKKLAIKIALPSSVCRNYVSKPYKELSTLEIDFRSEKFIFNEMTKDELREMIITQITNKKWLYNSKEQRAYITIIEENKRYQEQCQQHMNKLRETRTTSLSSISLVKSRIINRIDKGLIDKNSEEAYNEGYKEIQDRMDKDGQEHVHDTYGWRWLYCISCHQIKREDEMSRYGGGKPNTGECSKCIRNTWF